MRYLISGLFSIGNFSTMTFPYQQQVRALQIDLFQSPRYPYNKNSNGFWSKTQSRGQIDWRDKDWEPYYRVQWQWRIEKSSSIVQRRGRNHFSTKINFAKFTRIGGSCQSGLTRFVWLFCYWPIEIDPVVICHRARYGDRDVDKITVWNGNKRNCPFLIQASSEISLR